MPFLPTLIGWSSCPMESGMKAGSPMPDSISMTCVVALAIAVRAVCVLRGVVDRGRQIDAVLVKLRQASRKDPRRNEVADDRAAVVEALVLAQEDVLHQVLALLRVEP